MRVSYILLGFIPVIAALQANLAGVVDWHKPLLGQPLLEPSPPSIVETKAGRRILAITQKNVIGALDEGGEVVWRQQLDESDPVVSYHVDGECTYMTERCIAQHPNSQLQVIRRLANLSPSCLTPERTLCDICSITIHCYRSSTMGETTTRNFRNTSHGPRSSRYGRSDP